MRLLQDTETAKRLGQTSACGGRNEVLGLLVPVSAYEEFRQGMPDNNTSETVLTPMLKQLNASSKDIEASAVMSRDGHTLANVLGQAVDANRLGAMCASMLSLAERTAVELKRGKLKQVLIQGEQGYVLLLEIGAQAVLAVISRPSANLGMLLVEARKIAREIAERKLL